MGSGIKNAPASSEIRAQIWNMLDTLRLGASRGQVTIYALRTISRIDVLTCSPSCTVTCWRPPW